MGCQHFDSTALEEKYIYSNLVFFIQHVIPYTGMLFEHLLAYNMSNII